MFKKFLVPIDGSQTSFRALETAADMAKAVGGELIVIHVVPSNKVNQLIVVGNKPVKDTSVKPTQIGKMVLDTAKDKLKDFAGAAEFDMEFGDAAEMAVTVAREKGAVAIVIGKRGLSGVEEFLLGSARTGDHRQIAQGNLWQQLQVPFLEPAERLTLPALLGKISYICKKR